MSGVNINAERCAEYLRGIGVEIPDDVARAWTETERETRARRRAHNREIKRSCGHFRTSWTRIIHSGGETNARCCLDCHKYVEFRGADFFSGNG